MGAQIHGETEIVLKNVKTGLVERIRSENTFQGSFIAKFLHGALDNQPSRNTYDSSGFRAAPWKATIGGLLLFRDGITEGEEFMPAGNIMVGKGSIDVSNSGNPSELGSYNAVESSQSASAITQVYDFTTNQANGEIGCVCLTSKEGGFVGYGNGSNTWTSLTRSALGQMYGNSSFDTISAGAVGEIATDGKRYAFIYDSSAQTITVRKYRTNGITNGSVFAGLYSESVHDVSGFPQIARGGGIVQYCGSNVFRMIPQADYTVAAGGTIDYLEYNATTDTLTAEQIVNSSGKTIRITTTSYYGHVYGFTKDGRFIAANNNGFSGGGAPIIIDITTGITIFDGASSPIASTGIGGGIFQITDGLYYTTIGGYGVIIDTVNGTMKPVDSGITSSWKLTNSEDGYFQGSNIMSAYLAPLLKNPLYLATINNLQTAVTKTAAQTMKVTYTLTEV